MGEEVVVGDAESPANVPEDGHTTIIYSLPWEGLREDQAKHLTKEVFGLSTDEEALLATAEELEYGFEFEMD